MVTSFKFSKHGLVILLSVHAEATGIEKKTRSLRSRRKAYRRPASKDSNDCNARSEIKTMLTSKQYKLLEEERQSLVTIVKSRYEDSKQWAKKRLSEMDRNDEAYYERYLSKTKV